MKKKLLPVLFIIIGIILAFYPYISNRLFEKSTSSKIETYRKKSKDLTKAKFEKMYQQAQKYNEEVAKSRTKLTDPFKPEDRQVFDYKKLLSIDSSGIMAYIEIPCISVELPIYHGTSAKVLEKGAGHLIGSSLPIGGKGTHSVITGHTGLSSAKMFTDLTEIKKGDLFYVHVLNRTLAYKVDNISVVLPEETDKLAIDNGRDYVTLVTCTPYGVNDHRLFVRGKRTEYIKQEHDQIGKRNDSQWMKSYQKALLIGIGIVLIFFAGMYLKRKLAERKHI